VKLGDLAVRAVIVALAVTLADARPARAADDAFAWTPPFARSVARGRQSGARFGLLDLRELDLEVDDLFDAANRQALSLAQQRLAEVPGVRAVFGPAGLLDITVDRSGKPSAHPVLARGDSESEGEAARQRVVRRADALGWFLTENGRHVRFFVDAPNWDAVEPKLAAALASSGLGLAPSAGGGIETRPLWPDPRRHRARFLPLGFAAAWAFFMLLAASRARISLARRRFARVVTGAAAAAAPFALVPVTGVRLAGGLAALGVAAIAFALRPRHDPRAAAARPPAGALHAILFVSAAIVAVGIALSPRLRVGTRQWSATPMFFVSVRAELDEPVVLREVRRLTDYLRDQPGVANAWSVADLFLGITFEGEDAAGIPEDPEEVRRILVQARTDPAVRLELSADHREALIGIRFADDPAVDRRAIVARTERYLAREMRPSLVRLDFSAAGASPIGRLVGQGLLAGDARERVLRICARSGRTLSPAEALSVQRVARAAALLPSADPPRLDAEIADAVRDFAAHDPLPIAAPAIDHLIVAAGVLSAPATAESLLPAVSVAYGPRVPNATLRMTAERLARRLAGIRRRHTARLDFKDMLYGANLPTEGVLADEVRSATAEAMGPVVGLPVAPDAPGAFSLDAAAIGGAPNDRVLSQIWNRALRAGLVAAAGTIGILLFLAAGGGGILALPLAFTPLAVAMAPSALLGVPVGLPMLSFLGGALVGGALLALLVAPGPRGNRR
jgi:hypothetical protein